MGDETGRLLIEMGFWLVENAWNLYMAEEEKITPPQKCGYKVSTPAGRTPCGSEDIGFIVTGKSPILKKELTTPICEKHVIDVHREYDYDSIKRLKTT